MAVSLLLVCRKLKTLLQQSLPAPTCYKYVQRSRRHNYTLSIKTDYDDRNFITRLLSKDMYRLFVFSISHLFDILYSCFLTTF